MTYDFQEDKRHKKRDDYYQNKSRLTSVGSITKLIEKTPMDFHIKGKACVNNSSYDVAIPFALHRTQSAGAPREKSPSGKVK